MNPSLSNSSKHLTSWCCKNSSTNFKFLNQKKKLISKKIMLRLISKIYPDLTTPCIVSISFFLYFDTESMLTRLILKRSGGKITISLRIEQIKLSKKFGNGGSMIFIGCGSNFVFLFFFYK